MSPHHSFSPSLSNCPFLFNDHRDVVSSSAAAAAWSIVPSSSSSSAYGEEDLRIHAKFSEEETQQQRRGRDSDAPLLHLQWPPPTSVYACYNAKEDHLLASVPEVEPIHPGHGHRLHLPGINGNFLIQDKDGLVIPPPPPPPAPTTQLNCLSLHRLPRPSLLASTNSITTTACTNSNSYATLVGGQAHTPPNIAEESMKRANLGLGLGLGFPIVGQPPPPQSNNCPNMLNPEIAMNYNMPRSWSSHSLGQFNNKDLSDHFPTWPPSSNSPPFPTLLKRPPSSPWITNLSLNQNSTPMQTRSTTPAIRRVYSTGDIQTQQVEMGDGSSNCEDLAKVCRYTPEEKKQKINRYRQKRVERNFHKKITYACRKTLADSRPRIRGRFARTEEGPPEEEEEKWDGAKHEKINEMANFPFFPRGGSIFHEEDDYLAEYATQVFSTG